jgi:RHS repeat-associated protein
MTYDANGNTLNDGTNSYVWDARNRLVSADNNAASFSYDPLGRRTAKTLLSSTTGFVYDGVNPVQEQSGGAVTANLLTGGVDEYYLRMDTTGTYSYLTDALGSTVALTDSTGASVEQYSYGPYGILSSNGNDSNSYTYTGRESDGLGIDYYRARYYNPATGRFLSEDPLGFDGGFTNLYAYVGDIPTKYTDPSGMQEIILDPALIDEALEVASPKQSLPMPDGGRLDLTGKPHFDPDSGEPIPTPHVHDPIPPNPPPYDNFPTGRQSVPRPATPDDLQKAIDHNRSIPPAQPNPLPGRKSQPQPNCGGQKIGFQTFPNCA